MIWPTRSGTPQGFAIDGHQIIFEGLCPSCQKR